MKAIAQVAPLETPLPAADMPGLLLVDDHQQTLDSLRALLRINGYRVDVAASGGEALTKLRRNRYVLMLLTCSCPVSGAWKCWKRSRGSIPTWKPW